MLTGGAEPGGDFCQKLVGEEQKEEHKGGYKLPLALPQSRMTWGPAGS